VVTINFVTAVTVTGELFVSFTYSCSSSFSWADHQPLFLKTLEVFFLCRIRSNCQEDHFFNELMSCAEGLTMA